MAEYPGTLRSLVTRLDRAIGVFLEASTAALVVAEIVILFVGILARYVFHRPLVWSDELASILFLWLAVLGSALAFRRTENLRMTTLVNKLSPAAQRQFAAIALAASLAFLAMILPASIEHVELEHVVITPTLEVSMTWRTLAMPVISISSPRNTNSGIDSRMKCDMPASSRATSTAVGMRVASAR